MRAFGHSEALTTSPGPPGDRDEAAAAGSAATGRTGQRGLREPGSNPCPFFVILLLKRKRGFESV